MKQLDVSFEFYKDINWALKSEFRTVGLDEVTKVEGVDRKEKGI